MHSVPFQSFRRMMREEGAAERLPPTGDEGGGESQGRAVEHILRDGWRQGGAARRAYRQVPRRRRHMAGADSDAGAADGGGAGGS